MNTKTTTKRIPFVGFLLKLAIPLMPLTSLCEECKVPSDAEAIEEGLATLRNINIERWRSNADSLGRWVCDKITASTNAAERIHYQKAYCDAILAMEFDRGDWHKTESSLDRFLCLARIGFDSFNQREEDRMQACDFLLTAFVRARCEIKMMEWQVAREKAAESAHIKERLAWQTKCAALGMPRKHGVLTRSGAMPTIRGAESHYQQMVSMCIDGEQLKSICHGLSAHRQQALLENIRFVIGRYPKWHVDKSNDESECRAEIPVGERCKR